MYSEADFLQRPAFTDPEIKRASLAGVILRMLSLKLGAIEHFPFVEMPEQRAISDGWQTLQELAAIDQHKQLSVIGRQMARLPVDVKLARMLVAANTHSVLHELLIISSFMGIQDPRERPAEAKEAADNAHRQFTDNASEFMAIINLWRGYRQAHEEFSQSQLRKWCEKSYLSYLRLREWRELHRQLLITSQELQWPLPAWQEVEQRLALGLTESKSAQLHYAQIHRALLAGLPTQIGHKNDKGQYEAPRQRRFQIFPASPLAKQAPNWCLVGNLLDTQKVWGLMAAKLEPEWVIDECAHLISKKYFDPHWSRSQGRVIGYCQMSLLGLVIAAKKPVHYGGLFPVEAREIFIRQALLTGEINSRSNFISRNIETLAKAQNEEAKQRRVGLVADDDWQMRWYLDRIPAEICSSESLDKWFRALPEMHKKTVLWQVDDLLLAEQSQAALFPKYFQMGNSQLSLHYCFNPGADDDGVTLDVPLHLLNALDASRISWLVPGLLEEKATALIRGLPKTLRRNYVPAPDFARAFAQAFPNYEGDHLSACMARFLSKATGAVVSALDFNELELDAHLHMNLRLADADGRILASSRDLQALKTQYADLAELAFSKQAGKWFSEALLTHFPEQEIPDSMHTAEGLIAYPALVCIEGGVHLQAFAQQAEAVEQHQLAIQYLLKHVLADKRKSCAKQLMVTPKLGLVYATIESAERLRSDCVQAAMNELTARDLSSIRKKSEFDALQQEISQKLFAKTMTVLNLVEDCLKSVAHIRVHMTPPIMGWAAANLADIKSHLNRLIYAGFLTRTPGMMLPHLPRYLKALSLRQERALLDPVKDQARMLELQRFSQVLDQHLSAGKPLSLAWQHFWQDVEELSVHIYAQELAQKGAQSAKRLAKQLPLLS